MAWHVLPAAAFDGTLDSCCVGGLGAGILSYASKKALEVDLKDHIEP